MKKKKHLRYCKTDMKCEVSFTDTRKRVAMQFGNHSTHYGFSVNECYVIKIDSQIC